MLPYRRLKASEVKAVREELLIKQGGRCALCHLPCHPDKACLDHDHTTGAVRGVLHSGCNALLGKVENNYKRFGVSNLSSFLAGCQSYMQRHLTNVTGLLHPTHKTDDEKRLARNKAAQKARARKKLTQ